MKKNLLLMLLSLAFTLNGSAVSVSDGFYDTNVANYITIEMQCEYVKPTKVKHGASCSPMKFPIIGFNGLRLYEQFNGLTL